MPILAEHKEILLAESENRTLPEWISFFNSYTKSQIYSFCYRHGKKIKKLSDEEKSKTQSQNGRKYNINQDYFKTWSRNMAYLLGFWFADGCIYGGKIFDITVGMKDKYIIKKFAEELQYEGNIQDAVDKQACRINFSCKVIYDDLVKLGGCECKSLVIEFPIVPEEYLSDFIRGYFDGDGSVFERKEKRINSAFTCGSKKFLDVLLDILREKAGIVGGSYDKSSMSLRFGNRDTLKLGEYLYQNNPELFLLRKKQKFKNIS